MQIYGMINKVIKLKLMYNCTLKNKYLKTRFVHQEMLRKMSLLTNNPKDKDLFRLFHFFIIE